MNDAARGKVPPEASGCVAWHTDNDASFNGKSLAQEPLYLINSHLVDTFLPGVWQGLALES